MGKYLGGSNEFWLDLHELDVERFKQEMIDIDSWDDFDDLVFNHQGEFKIIIDDYSTRLKKKIEKVIYYFSSGKSKILYVVGARDSGKTCFSFWLAEKIHDIKPRLRIAYVGVSINKQFLPDWCKNFVDINEVPNGWLVILDELAVAYNARDYASQENKSLGQLLAIARHKDLSVIAITQDPNMGEINVWRLKDMVVYKRSNTYELPDRDTKRQSKVLKFWRFIKNWLKPTRQEQALFEYQSEKKIMLFKYELPKCWSEGLSKAFNMVDVSKKKASPINTTTKRRILKI